MSKETNPYVKISPQLQEAAQQHKGDIKGKLLSELQVAYDAITGKVLTIGCSSCISTGLKIVVNYLNKYPQSERPQQNTVVERVNTFEQAPDNQLKLRELRVKYPQIKARSVTGFIKDLEEWKAAQ